MLRLVVPGAAAFGSIDPNEAIISCLKHYETGRQFGSLDALPCVHRRSYFAARSLIDVGAGAQELSPGLST